MRKYFVSSLIIAAVLAAGCTRVGPGYVGVKVSMAGDDKGVGSVPSTTGWTFYNPFLSSVYEYPTFNQTTQWTKSTEDDGVNEEITFNNADQMLIGVDVNVSYSLDPSKIPAFYVKFRSDDLRNFTHGYLRNEARDQFVAHAGKYKIDQIMGDNATFVDEVKASLQKRVAIYGVNIDQFGIIGAPRPPQVVVDAINAKVHATQLAIQKQNELVQAQADAAKVVAAAEGQAQARLKTAEAEATANRKIAESITPTLVEYQRTQKWNGALPQVTGGGAALFTLK